MGCVGGDGGVCMSARHHHTTPPGKVAYLKIGQHVNAPNPCPHLPPPRHAVVNPTPHHAMLPAGAPLLSILAPPAALCPTHTWGNKAVSQRGQRMRMSLCGCRHCRQAGCGCSCSCSWGVSPMHSSLWLGILAASLAGGLGCQPGWLCPAVSDSLAS